MSITVNLKRISNLPGRSDRKVELTFRGFSHKTRVLQCENVAVFNQHFRWPHYGNIMKDEVLCVSVYNMSKVFSHRLLGKLVVSLQHAVLTGRLLLREPLTDVNYSLTEIYVELELVYNPLQGAAGGWDGQDFLKRRDSQSSLVIRNLGYDDPESQSDAEALERETRRIGRALVRTGDTEDDDQDEDDEITDIEASNITLTPLLSRFRPLSRHVLATIPRVQSFQVNINILEAQKLVGVNINPAVFIRVGNQKKHTSTQKSTNCPFYNENFMFEFQETADTLFDQVIEMKVFHRRTLAFLMTHIGTFKIDIATVYSQPDHGFFQKWAPLSDPGDTRAGVKGYVKATLSVLMRGEALTTSSLPPASGVNQDIDKNLLLPKGLGAERPWARFTVGVYRAEGLPTMEAGILASLSKASDRKVFINPYVQVDFAGQQGETSVVSSSSSPVWNEQISFIEQFPPLARRIRVQVLDDAALGDVALATHFLDFEQISDPTRNGFNATFGPSWVNLYGSPQNSTLGDVHQALNEGLGEGIFYRGRILLALNVTVYSSPSGVNTETGSALGKVKGAMGKFMTTKKKKSKKRDKKEGSAESKPAEEPEIILEVPEAVTVETEEVHPLPEGFLGPVEEFLMFATLFEVTKMDPSVGTRPLTFELSLGNCGKMVEMRKSKKDLTRSREDLMRSRESLGRSRENLGRSRENLGRSREDLNEEAQGLLESEEELDREESLNPEPPNRSISAPMKPQPTEYDRSYCCIPLQPPAVRLKPCLWLWARCEDHSSRLYQTNWLHKMAARLEVGLDDVDLLLRRPRSNVKERLVEVLLELVASVKQFSVMAAKRVQSRPNNLDRCRKEFIKKKLILLARQAVRIKKRVTRRTAKQRLVDARKIQKKLRLLAKEPQSTLPDVFLWLLSGRKRLAYVRIPAHSILFSLVEEQRGTDCGKVTTLFMKTPGCAVGQVFAKLEVYLWLGPTKYSKEALNSLPEDFLPVYEEQEEQEGEGQAEQRRAMPVSLSCQDSRYFQLRCHLYQGRGLMAADDNGLSDPFARVVFSTHCQVTRVVSDTLSPAWCECLVFDRVLLEGSKEELERDPPLIIISIYDYDTMGSPEPLGRAFAEPQLQLVERPYQKPRLRFYDITRGKSSAGELLAAFEMIELDYSGFGEPCLPSSVEPQEVPFVSDRFVIPEEIQPKLTTFRIEVLFWGLRELRRVQLFEVERPLVRVECGGKQLESEEMLSYKGHPNFKDLVRYFDVELPEQPNLHPPLTVFVVEQRAFGSVALVGTHQVPSLMAFTPPELGDMMEEEEEEEPKPVTRSPGKVKALTTVKKMNLMGLSIKQSKIPSMPLSIIMSQLGKLTKKAGELEEDSPEEEELDWWSKYYASLDELERQAAEDLMLEEQAESDMGALNMDSIEDEDEVVVDIEPPKPKRKKIATLKVYSGDLEAEFRQFQDWLKIFPLLKGKVDDDDEEGEEERLMGKYKGSFLIYPISPGEEDGRCQITDGVPKNSPLKVLVRVYVLKATGLAPADLNGKADPYLMLKAGQQKLSTRENYIPKHLNPVFGEVFDLTVSFPLETELLIAVMDHNLVGSDDVIGETKLDLENRFYSRHLACCGLAQYYNSDGYNKWRDSKNPSSVLASLCRSSGIDPPEFRPLEVKVLNKIFKIPPDAVPEVLLKKNQRTAEEEAEMEEHAALSVLHRWGEMREFLSGACPLVPEHVEVRPLMNSDKPGLPQGYLHMWVDMFPTDVPAPPPVDIKPRLPMQYELRVTIWNTDDVFLDDVNPFTGIPSSDIYVKGWIKGLEGDKQETDVHFNSLTGEGNFNWRFVFRFDYLPTEKEVVYKKKESFFSLEKTEFRQPAVLVLQVWDYDRILANDFLGSIELRLSDMVRAAKTSEKCSIQMSRDRAGPRLSIFRSKRMKGWWPLIRLKSQEDVDKELKEEEEAKKKGKKKTKSKRGKMKKEDIEFTDSGGNTYLLMGKVEAEFKLVALEEAEINPVGRARKEPEPLEKPNRPSLSFSWFVNPMKTFIFFIWKNYKKYIIALVVLAVLSVFLGLIIYTLPGQISAAIFGG
ncbi:fer-1-like protein 4 [Gadus chalcogrammus]|uniref:fer-1-like protein 4 n=1 Tax=Gadus chalcogrammus TaxID=1042646 RepID=UPI0024C4ABE6|nr:fer-1-like protein 4 [Gadus chalcogrammus]